MQTIQISIPRGDFHQIRFKIKEGSTIITPTNKDIIMTIKEDYNIKEYKIQKKYSNNTITYNNEYYYVDFTTNDTKDLQYATYFGDIKIIEETNKPHTVAYVRLLIEEEATNNTVSEVS